MRLWILRPVMASTVTKYGHVREEPVADAWRPWYDKAFGFVVRAESEQRAREIAQESGGDEVRNWNGPPIQAWTNPDYSTCVELSAGTLEGVIMCDFKSA